MLEVITYHSLKPGARLLILGGVHGNEICGPAALRATIKSIAEGHIKIEAGSLTIVPVCNPRAFEEDKRFIERNLNRAMATRETPAMYEEALMNILCPLLDRCDYLLDIHSYRAGGPAFALRGPDTKKEKEEEFIAAMALDHVVYGWDEAYIATGISTDSIEFVGTTEYARRQGAVAATVECGQHRDPAAVPVALRAIMGALRYSGVAPGVTAPEPQNHLRRTRMKHLYYKRKAGEFLQPWRHLDEVAMGTPMAKYEDGETILAPFSGRVVMPRIDCPVGEEWFYLGSDET
jgi:predicted deacylase